MRPVALVRRVVRLIWGDEVDRALRPILAVSLAGSVAGSTVWTFLGIWAIKELGASNSELGVAFLLGALLASAAGYLGGHLSDHIGRRPLILFGWGGHVLLALSYLTVGDTVLLGLGLMMMAGVFGSIGGAADQAMIADLVAPARHEAAYAANRVASNLGVTLGPPLGGLLLLIGDWPMLFVGAATLGALAFAIAYRYIPARGRYSPEQPPERGSFGVIRRDRAFLLFLVSGGLAYLVYVAFEAVLPISLVDTHGLSPSTWGFLVIVNPALVTLFQLRLTRWVADVPPAPKLVVAMLLMGWPFLLLSVNAALPVVALVLLIFVIGEMLWVPTSQSVIAALAPEDLRGAYMGAFSSTAAVGFALAPFIGLQIRDLSGDTAMWAFFAGASVLAAATGGAACAAALDRVRQARMRDAELPTEVPVQPAA